MKRAAYIAAGTLTAAACLAWVAILYVGAS
jgi:hypothetical protein